MTSSDWARFAAAYAIGAATTAIMVMVLEGFLDGFRHTYRGVHIVAVVCAPFEPLSIAFGDMTRPPRHAPLYVIKVIGALAFLSALLVGLVEAFASWQGGWQGAAWTAAAVVILYPLLRVDTEKREYGRAPRASAHPQLRP